MNMDLAFQLLRFSHVSSNRIERCLGASKLKQRVNVALGQYRCVDAYPRKSRFTPVRLAYEKRPEQYGAVINVVPRQHSLFSAPGHCVELRV